METQIKNSFFFLIFLLFTVGISLASSEDKFLNKRRIKVNLKISPFKPFNNTLYSSFVIQAPKGKKTGTINFNLRRSKKIMSLGIINNNFSLFSNKKQYLTVKSKKSIIQARNVITNEIASMHKVTYHTVSQWRLIAEDTWNKNLTTNGWDFDLVSQCQHSYFFGGHCLLSKKEISKTYTNIPKHSMIRIESFYHHLGKWNSNSGYLKLANTKDDHKYLWTNICKNKQSSIYNNLCGYETCKINVPISVTIPHKKTTLAISFGADLNHDHSCEASYAVSEIRIYVR